MFTYGVSASVLELQATLIGLWWEYKRQKSTGLYSQRQECCSTLDSGISVKCARHRSDV